jgi:hypothetical protein
MNKIPHINIPYEELKHFVLESISKSGDSFQFINLCNSIGSNAIKKGIVTNPNPPGHQVFSFPLQVEDENRVREVLWDLIIERVLTIGDYNNDSWPWLSLTDYGKKAIKSKLPIPNDPTGYLNRIKNEIPQLDPIIEIYLSESIRTYNINQLLSSTIALGCASEKALLLLIDTYQQTFDHIQGTERFGAKVKNRMIKIQFEEFQKDFRRIVGDLPKELTDNYENILLGVFEMFRNQRNQAGHPTGHIVNKETLFANLQVFVGYCKRIYDIITHLEKKQHS